MKLVDAGVNPVRQDKIHSDKTYGVNDGAVYFTCNTGAFVVARFYWAQGD